MTLLIPPDRADLIRSGRREGIRFVLDPAAWRSLAADAPTRAEQVPLLGLWADGGGFVHALFHDGRSRPLIASVAVEAGRYHALSMRIAAASPFERLIRDLWGYEAMHALDLRALIDHGAWEATAPMAARPGPPARSLEAPEWRAPGRDGDDGLAYRERGPVGGPGAGLVRTRLKLSGTTVRDVELQHGYGHRGIPALVAGLTPDAGVRIVARTHSGGMVASAAAFSAAVEAASGTLVPPRAAVLREAALELERATAFLDVLIGCGQAAGARRLVTESWVLVERLRAASQAVFGHRHGAGLVVPGGLARDLGEAELAALSAAGAMVGEQWRALAALYEAPDGLAARLAGLGRVTAAAAARAAASGIVGRASGQPFDARRATAVVPVEAPSSELGCADARMRLRLAGIAQAATRWRRLGETLTPGPVRSGLGAAAGEGFGGEGLGLVEAPEGELWHFVRLAPDGTVAAFFPREPSMIHLPLFEAACAGADEEDAAAIRASFGLSAEAVDL